MAKQLISKTIGIDLGTTNSAVAIMNPTDTKPVIHRDASTKRETTPSCVWKEPRSGEVVVGRKAYSRIGSSPPPIRSIKRRMGRQEKVLLVNEEATPEQVSAHILREIKRQIEEDVAQFSTEVADWIVDRAIITVPAYFDMPQIEATRRAGELAGLQVLELLHEPTAAACYHCYRSQIQNGMFLVYDLGGGTFDVSVLRCTVGAFEVLGISGNNYLGGDDIDAVLAKRLLQQLQQEGYSLVLDLENDQEDRLRFDMLKKLMEGVKMALSTRDDFLLRDTMSLKDKDGNWVEIESQFERSEIEALIDPIIKRTIPYCHEALKKAKEKAGVTLADVDAIILAGGSTHIPLIREMVRRELCADPEAHGPRAKCAEPIYDDVDSIVALGAAIRASDVGGLVIDNPQGTVRVSFQGVGATNASQVHIGGQVAALDSKLDLEGGHVRLTIPGLDFEDECDLSKSGSFGFKRIPLQQRAENLLRFEIYDGHNTLLAVVGRSVAQDPDNLVPGTGPTNVLTKPISLEVIRAGDMKREELIKAPATLPIEKTFSLAHPGGAEQVRFSLYQYEKKIKEVLVAVPPTTTKDTPIDFHIKVDELAYISCKGSIGTVSFQFAVEAPKDRSITRHDVKELDKKFTELPSEKQNHMREDWQEIKERANEAIGHGDQPGAVHEVEEMESWLQRAATREPKSLQPPKEEFKKLIQDSIDRVEYADRAALRLGRPFDAVTIENAIEEQRRLGEMAFEAGDQKAYTKAWDMLESIYNHMARLINSQLPLPAQAQNYIHTLKSVIAEAKPLARGDRLSQLTHISKNLDTLSLETESNPSEVITRVRQLQVQVEQIINTLNVGPIDSAPPQWPSEGGL